MDIAQKRDIVESIVQKSTKTDISTLPILKH